MNRPIAFPRPLRIGDRIGVTSPSSGVSGAAAKRIEFCIDWLRDRGYDVVVGNCMDGTGITAGTARERAEELTNMLVDPTIAAVVPPWGGETAIDLVDLLDWERLAAAQPTWLVGFSDLSTILLPITTRLGWATVHGDNLADTPIETPPGLTHWLDLISAEQPAAITQHDSELLMTWVRFEEDHEATTFVETGRRRWQVLGGEPTGGLEVTGRLIGGCIETLANLAGTAYGDVRAFGRQHSRDGLIVYLEAAEDNAATICRNLHGLRLAGWFEQASAILIGATSAPDDPQLSQREAVVDALGRVGVPIVFDLEIGHVPPHLPLVNGALATVRVNGDERTITQWIG